MIARMLLAAAALLAAAWLAFSIHDNRLQDAAKTIAFSPHPSRAQLLRGAREAHDARRLAPDADPKLIEQQLLREAGEVRNAERLLQQIVRNEPNNVQAWAVLARTARDPAVAARARARVRELVAGL